MHILNEETRKIDRKDEQHVGFVGSGHADSVDMLCWHPLNPDVLATASGDKTVRVWDAKKNRDIASIATKGRALSQ